MARLVVRVQPGARRSGFVGWYGELPRLAVAAPPVEGAANDEAVRVIASVVGVPRHRVRLVLGRAGRTKHFEVDGVDPDELARRLGEIVPDR